MTKRKKCFQWSDVIQVLEFLQQAEAIISENPEKPTMEIAELLLVAESTCRLYMHDIIRHNGYAMDLFSAAAPA